MTSEELAFKDRTELANLNEIDLLNIIEFLQTDRKQWINQFSKTHNENVEIQRENKKLKDNWNELKKLLNQKYYNGERIDIKDILDIIQELEQGNDNNGR